MALFEGRGMRGDERDDIADDAWHEGYEAGRAAQLKEIIASSAAAPKRYHITEQDGKAVQEILRRYVGEELQPEIELLDRNEHNEDNRAYHAEISKDINHIEGLIKLFD